MKIILIFTWIGTLYIAFVYRDSLNFVSYEDVYIQRSATEALGRDVFTSYFGAWLANVLIPFSVTYGLFSNKKIYFISGTVASVIIYMSTADKAIFLFPLIIFVIFKFLKNKNLKNSLSSIGIGLNIIMSITLISGFTVFSALFWMRTLGNGGLLTTLYHEFFSTHPNTFFSHINVVNAITQSYPYENKSLGQVVGNTYFSDLTNANANFWATDGIASLGENGIIFSSIILFLILILFNRITAHYNKIFVICVLIPFLSTLLNQSLFSSLLTGGGFWIIFILSFKNMLTNSFINENNNNTGSKTSIY
ncbi:hypothetical protein [Paenimyroides baculatum]|uniref:Oligosaccharide repeat unit polymerase n=1 Tax=Paenimyroides baculatum TaxID=2608000 RepID=A0A5M6CLT1_9FLAO|nr:hypothetical protein [Paenimyroides baculatum]KAA5535390.1 hypothetical protein F0460_08730 [Paenimyroides baculatum]